MNQYNDPIEVILERCVLEVQSGDKSIEDCLHAYPENRRELEPLLRLAIDLRAAPKATAPSKFKAGANTRMANLINARSLRSNGYESGQSFYQRFVRSLSGSWVGAPVQLGRRRLSVLALMVIFILTIATISSGVLAVSANALPGDMTYPAKTALEKVRLTLSQSDIGDSYLYLTFANRRMNEVSTLVERENFEHMDSILEEYVRNIFYSMSILFESDSLSNQERASLASKLAEVFTQNEEQINNLLEQTPATYKISLEEIQKLSHYEHRIVRELLLNAPWGIYRDTSLLAGIPTITLEYKCLLPTYFPEIDWAEFPGELPAIDPGNKVTRTVFPVNRGTPIPWWWMNLSFRPSDIDWSSIWPTFADQTPEFPLGTELPSNRQTPPNLPTDIPTRAPEQPTERQPSLRTPRPPRP